MAQIKPLTPTTEVEVGEPSGRENMKRHKKSEVVKVTIDKGEEARRLSRLVVGTVPPTRVQKAKPPYNRQKAKKAKEE